MQKHVPLHVHHAHADMPVTSIHGPSLRSTDSFDMSGERNVSNAHMQLGSGTAFADPHFAWLVSAQLHVR